MPLITSPCPAGHRRITDSPTLPQLFSGPSPCERRRSDRRRGLSGSCRICAPGFVAWERPPDAVAVEDLAGSEGVLVLHRLAPADPVAEVVPRDAEQPRLLDLVERAERPQPAAGGAGVEVEVDAAEGFGAGVEDPPRQEPPAGVPVFVLDRVHR